MLSCYHAIILSKYIMTCLPSDGSYVTGIFAFCHTDHVTPAKMPLHFLNCFRLSLKYRILARRTPCAFGKDNLPYPVYTSLHANIESPQIKYPTLIISPDDAYPDNRRRLPVRCTRSSPKLHNEPSIKPITAYTQKKNKRCSSVH